MNFKFKKPPLYFYLVGWILFAGLAHYFRDTQELLHQLFVLLFFLMPIIFAYLWLLKNKLRVKKLYIFSRKKFKHIFYTIESAVILIFIGLVISLINVGGYKNFIERAKFEYIVFNDEYDMCSNANGWSFGYGEFDKFFWKANTQFIDYFQFKPYKVVKDIVILKDQTLFRFNHCKAFRYLIKDAHQGNKISKDILSTIPIDLGFYEFNDEWLFERYTNSINEKKLYNAALVYSFANKTNKNGYLLSVDKRRELLKEAAEDGYLLAMQEYLTTFAEGEMFDKSECQFILKYSKHLYEQKSLMDSIYSTFALMGKINTNGARYICSDKKTDFAKAIIYLDNFNKNLNKPKPTSNFVTTYPAMIYFNGWGNVDKDQELAIKLFKKNLEGYTSEISKAYLTLNNLNNGKNDLKLLYEILDSAPTTFSEEKKYIICNNIKYNFKLPKVENETTKQKDKRKLKFLEPLKKCLDNASREQRIETVKSYIKSWIDNWFRNPEIVKTLNLYG